MQQHCKIKVYFIVVKVQLLATWSDVIISRPFYSQVSHRNPRFPGLLTMDPLILMSYHQKSTILIVTAMMKQRLYHRMAAAAAPADVIAFG